MADQYVKPGNKERGWNDPPQFSYGLQAQLGSGKRTPLNKRVPAPLHGPPAAPAVQTLPSSTPPKCPASTVGPPPLGQAALQIKSDGVKSCSSPTEVECNIDVKDVITPLNETLEACRDAIKKQVFNDISKRLTMLEEMWNSGKLSPPVRKRMSILIKELKCQNWDSADEIHRSLMVDYVNEVSQWMVGVKRLIAEARNLPTHEKDEKPEVSTGEDVKQEM